MLDDVYVEPRCRSLGFGSRLIKKIQEVAGMMAHKQEKQSAVIFFDTIKPSLNGMYLRKGAQVINDSLITLNDVDAVPCDALYMEVVAAPNVGLLAPRAR